MKVFIISHIGDSDGVTPVILAKLAFDEVKSVLYEINDVNEGVANLINDHAFDDYDKVYITDLGISDEVLTMIDTDGKLKSKLLIFDHHIGNYHARNYSFATVIDTDEQGKMQCATSLFHDYLIKNYNNHDLSKESVSYFVNLVREYDTWEWAKTNNLHAKHLGLLLNAYGREYFIEHFYTFLKEHDTFYYDEKELFFFDITEKQIETYIEEKKEQVIPVSILNYKAGLVFASQHHSLIGNRLAEFFIDKYDFIILINVERSVSYRGVKDINLVEIANVFGGSGHFHATGSPLPENFHKNIIELIFKDKVKLDSDSI